MSIEDNLLLGAFQRHRSGKRDHPETMEEVYALFPRLKSAARRAGTDVRRRAPDARGGPR